MVAVDEFTDIIVEFADEVVLEDLFPPPLQNISNHVNSFDL